MGTVKVEVKATRGKSLSDLCSYEQIVLESMRSSYERLDFNSSSGIPSSKLIKEASSEFFLNGNWHQSFLFDNSISEAYPTTNYQIDAVLDTQNSGCPHRHRILVEHCFDNRQAIGTNLLKFELASSIFEKELNSRALSVMICADKSSLKTFGWDGSIASSEEYENAIRSAYCKLFHTSPVLIVIRSD